MQDGWRRMLAERVEHRGERQLAAVPQSERPAQYLASPQVEHDR